MLDNQGNELDERLGASLDDAPPSASEQLGGPSPRMQERSQEMADKRAGALEKRTARLQAQQDKMEKRYGPEKAAELMEERGFKDGKIIPSGAGEGMSLEERNRVARDKVLDQYWKRYSDSGSPLDPITWAKRNLPGLADDPSRLKPFAEKSGHSYESILANPTQYTESRMPDNPDGTPGDMVMRVKNQTGLDGGKVNDPRGEGYSYQTERTHDSLNAQANEKGISRWQAGADLDRDREYADKNWVRSLAKYKELYKTKLRSNIEFIPEVFDEYKHWTQEGAVRELSSIVMGLQKWDGIGNGAGSVIVPDINTAALSPEDWRSYNQDSNMRTYVESQVLKGWMQRKGQDDIDKADDIARRFPEVAKKSKDAHDRTVAAAENVVNSRKAVIQAYGNEIGATEDSRGLTQSLLDEKKKQAQMERDHAQAVKENLQDQINMIQNEEKIIKKQIEHNKKGEELEKRGFGGVYLSDGGHVDDQLMGTEMKELASGGASAFLSNAVTGRGNPFTGRNIGSGFGGHTGALIGEGVDIAAEGAYHMSQHGGGFRGFGTGAVAGYGAMVAGDFAGEVASLVADPEAATKRYDAANRRQANQGYAGNVVENLMGPGQAIMQLGREASGLSSDLMKNRQDAMKRNPAASPGRRAQRRQYGGVIYAANGMMVPRGTDTVPAMLTPGEFVVNRRAAQANMPLLNSINNGVQYLQNGGVAGGSSVNLDAFSNVLQTVTDSLNLFNAALIQATEGNAGGEAGGVNTNGIAQFTQNLSTLLVQLENIKIPDQMNVDVGGTVNVNVTGGEAFAKLAQQSINSTVHQQLKAAFGTIEKETENQIKNPFTT